ncbi:MAG: hypothetical protein WCI17_10240 [bacterium]
MHAPRLAALVVVALFVLTGCIVQERPVAYRTYPPAYAPPPPPPGAPPAAQPDVSSDTSPGVPPVPGQEQPEVLTRGPVHEAFAQPVTVQTPSGLVVAGQPPATIVETPPSDRPAGGNCMWVPGYWSWDSESSRFIWVSGCWRLTPTRMTWVPGYWARVSGGWQWISGFWAPAATQEIAYLPAPPAVTENPPTVMVADQIWIPGCWYWAQGRYVLRSGYWLQPRAGWVWAPSHYVWTPRGHVFVEGYWDFPLESRGVLFAPVCFAGRAGGGVAFAFSPSITVNLGAVSASLFACPRYTHYYFGDYYDDAWVSIGIYPWFDCVRIGTWYDPLFVHARWDHGRRDPRWEERERHEYRQRHDDRDRRPPRTYREQEERAARLPEPQRRERQVAQPLRTAITAPATSMKFERVDRDARQKVVKESADAHTFRDARGRWEAATPAPQAPAVQPPAATRQPAGRKTTAPKTSLPARDTPPTAIQPDRVRFRPTGAVEQPAAPRNGERSTPDKPSDEHKRDRSSRDER